MQKKTMWITAAAVGAVLVLGGTGVAVASSDVFDNDDDRSTSTSSGSNADDRSLTDDDRDDNDNDNSGSGSSDDRDIDDNSDDSDDSTVPATDDERSAAEAAALDEIGEGTVREFKTGDADDDYAYKVELVMDDNSEVEVELADDLSILRIDRN
jgi:uncharacterized membrane protein YkoI